MACTLALSLAIPAVATSNQADAASKKPKLTMKSFETIISGKTKKFTIRNVKKKNVKKLTVKIYNKNIAKVTKQTKTNFTVKGIGGGLTDVDVIVKLKKKVAGKKTYKFQSLTIASGSAKAPQLSLGDSVTENELLALVLKAGTEASFDKVDNELRLDIGNKGAIGGRNLFIKWYEDGKEREDWSRDAAGGQNYRPETPAVSGSATTLDPTKIPEFDPENPPESSVASGAAIFGYVEKNYQCEVENTLSKQKSTSNVKRFRLVPQAAIDAANVIVKSFIKAYPDATQIKTDKDSMLKFLKGFHFVTNTFGYILGVTPELLASFKDGVEALKNDPKALEENIVNDVALFKEDLENVAKYLGADVASADAYFDYFGFILKQSAVDSAIDITKLLS